MKSKTKNARSKVIPFKAIKKQSKHTTRAAVAEKSSKQFNPTAWRRDLSDTVGRLVKTLSEYQASIDLTPYISGLVALQTKLKGRALKIGIVGPSNVGKSLLANLLLSANGTYKRYLPVKDQTLTRAWTRVRAPNEKYNDGTVVLVERDGSEIVVDSEIFSQMMESESATYFHMGTEHRFRDLLEVHIYLDHPLLNAGVEIIDSPGLGSLRPDDTQTTTTNLSDVDAVLACFTLKGAQSDIWGDLKFQVQRGIVIPVFTHIDDREYEDDHRNLDMKLIKSKAQEKAGAVLESLKKLVVNEDPASQPFPAFPAIFAVSGIMAKKAMEKGGDLAESGFQEFLTGLEDWIHKNGEQAVRQTFFRAFSEQIESLNTRLEEVKRINIDHVILSESSFKMAKDAIQSEVNTARVEMSRALKKFDQEVSSGVADRAEELRTRLTSLTTKSSLRDFLQANFKNESEAKNGAARRLQAEFADIIQRHVTSDIKDNGFLGRASSNLGDSARSIASQFEAALKEVSVSNIQNAEGSNNAGLFIGVGGSALTAAGLALAASAAGNLGGYILIAQALGLVGGLGLSMSTIMAAVAAIGGPIVIAIPIVIAVGVLLNWLFGSSWDDDMAEKMSEQIKENQVVGTLVNNYRTAIQKITGKVEKQFAGLIEALDENANAKLNEARKAARREHGERKKIVDQLIEIQSKLSPFKKHFGQAG